MSAFEATQWLALAREVAKQAGATLLAKQQEYQQVNSAKAHDIKLKGDELIEADIVASLTANSPYPILAEEDAALVETQRHEHYWVVDPIDGSLNFSRDIPLFCIAIALCYQEQPLLGVIYDPLRDECFTGIVGQGAWLNEQPMAVSHTQQLSQAVLATGFPSLGTFAESALLQRVKLIQNYKKIRLLGSAALSLAYVACGRVDAYQESGIMRWDVAAGLALVLAAGGRSQVSAYQGQLDQLNVYAGNAQLPHMAEDLA